MQVSHGPMAVLLWLLRAELVTPGNLLATFARGVWNAPEIGSICVCWKDHVWGSWYLPPDLVRHS